MRMKLALTVVAALMSGCAMAATEYKSADMPPMAPPASLTTASTFDEADALGRLHSPVTSVPGSIGKPASPPIYAADQSPATRPAEARLVIYSAGFKIVVADVPGTIRSIIASAEKLGGYMQEVGGSTVIVRVPAAKFQDAVTAIEGAGEVVDRQIRAQDITEEMRDLRIRLENAETLRKRLLDILAKADKVEDAIKVERELARVSEEIDAAKGKIRYLESQAAMSTLRVELNSPVPQNARGSGPRLPFAWVEELGDGLVAGQVNQQVKKAGFFSRGPAFKPPAGFVRYYEEEKQTDAMDAGGLLLRVQRHPNIDKADLQFWSKLIERSLVANRSVVITSEEWPGGGHLFRGTRDVGGKPFGYVVSIKRSNKYVTIFEAWGPKEQFDPAYDGLRNSAASVEED